MTSVEDMHSLEMSLHQWIVEHHCALDAYSPDLLLELLDLRDNLSVRAARHERNRKLVTKEKITKEKETNYAPTSSSTNPE